MDDKWFKQKQKQVGVTAEEIARELGRDRSVVSRIYVGRQRMTLDQAKIFARVLNQPLDEVLARAGVLLEDEASQVRPGFAESDLEPMTGKGVEQERNRNRAAHFGGEKPGFSIWIVKSLVMSVGGFLPGDYVLVDANQSERCKPGDVVLAHNFNRANGKQDTILRRYEPPVLVTASSDPAHGRVLVVDHNNVVIKGKVIASWRT